MIDRTRTLTVRAWQDPAPPSNVESRVYTMMVAMPSATPSGGTFGSAQTMSLSTTTPDATIRYTLDGSTPTPASTPYTAPFTISKNTTVKSLGFRDGWTTSALRTTIVNIQVGAPTMSPAPGTYSGSAQVTLSAMSGATIRYTTNGTTPTSGSPIYTAPITVTSTTTLKAKAFHPEYAESLVVSGTYTITP